MSDIIRFVGSDMTREVTFCCARCDRCCHYDYSNNNYDRVPFGVCPKYHAICGNCLRESIRDNTDLHNFLVKEYHYNPIFYTHAVPIPSKFCYHCSNITETITEYKALLHYICHKYHTSISNEISDMDMNIFVCQNCIGVGSDGLDGDTNIIDELFKKYDNDNNDNNDDNENDDSGNDDNEDDDDKYSNADYKALLQYICDKYNTSIDSEILDMEDYDGDDGDDGDEDDEDDEEDEEDEDDKDDKDDENEDDDEEKQHKKSS